MAQLIKDLYEHELKLVKDTMVKFQSGKSETEIKKFLKKKLRRNKFHYKTGCKRGRRTKPEGHGQRQDFPNSDAAVCQYLR